MNDLFQLIRTGFLLFADRMRRTLNIKRWTIFFCSDYHYWRLTRLSNSWIELQSRTWLNHNSISRRLFGWNFQVFSNWSAIESCCKWTTSSASLAVAPPLYRTVSGVLFGSCKSVTWFDFSRISPHSKESINNWNWIETESQWTAKNPPPPRPPLLSPLLLLVPLIFKLETISSGQWLTWLRYYTTPSISPQSYRNDVPSKPQ